MRTRKPGPEYSDSASQQRLFMQQSPSPQSPNSAYYATQALSHVRYLADKIGARPSTGEGERRAAQYAARVLEEIGISNPATEPFESARSTYRPYLLAFGAALLGGLGYTLRPRRFSSVLATIAHIAAASGFAREASLQDNWMRRVLPKGESQNVIGVVAAQGEAKRRVVVYGHLDSHRTPIFYSNPLWLKLFSNLVALGFLSLVVGTVIYGCKTTMSTRLHSRLRKALGVLQSAGTGVQSLAALLTWQADTTPYSPGANDNASGAASVLALAERMAQNPLPNTEVWFLLNGCEEVGCYGIKAFLEAHGDALRDAYFIDFDMVGIGAPSLLTQEGLLRPVPADKELLQLAREAAVLHRGLLGGEHPGGAYTDTGMVTIQGFRGLTIDSQRPVGHPAEKHMGYWHQMEDTAEKIEMECLQKTHEFGWRLLQHIDEQSR